MHFTSNSFSELLYCISCIFFLIEFWLSWIVQSKVSTYYMCPLDLNSLINYSLTHSFIHSVTHRPTPRSMSCPGWCPHSSNQSVMCDIMWPIPSTRVFVSPTSSRMVVFIHVLLVSHSWTLSWLANNFACPRWRAPGCTCSNTNLTACDRVMWIIELSVWICKRCANFRRDCSLITNWKNLSAI